MIENKDEQIYVIKDNRGNYCGSNSISYNKRTKVYDYTYSKFLTNGFYRFCDKASTEEVLTIIQEKGVKIKNGITFHIEEINRKETMFQESKKNIPKSPFIHEYYKNGVLVTREGFIIV